MQNKYQMMTSVDIRRRITEIMQEASKLKVTIFKSVMMNTELESKAVASYMGRVNDFLRGFEEYAEDLSMKMKGVSGRENIHTLEYNFVKEYIYGKYDYASVLPLADGLIKGLTSGKFKNVSDIEDYREEFAEKNFDDLPGDAAGVLDGVVNPGMGVDFNHVTTPVDAKMFDSIKNYKMFDPRSRTELYRAIDKTIEFITIDLRKRAFPQAADMKLFVSMINNIIEYITYSLTVYACRIFIISSYVYPFIYACQVSHSRDSETAVVSEAADNGPTKSEGEPDNPHSSNNIEVTIMRDADEKLTKNPTEAGKFFEVFDDFVKTIGAQGLFDGEVPKFSRFYISNDILGSNKFLQKMQSNALYIFLFKDRYSIFGGYGSDVKNLEELNQVLKSLAYNNQSMPANTTARQEILHIIRGVDADKSSVQKDLETVKDLYLCAISMLGTLCRVIDDITRWNNEAAEKERFGIAARNLGTECLRITSELYRELCFAFMSRARDLESKINLGRNAQIAKVTDGLSLDIFKGKKNAVTTTNDASSTHNMMTAIPDTTRIPMDLLDLYAQPAFESMQLSDACLQMDPMFEGDLYFSEAFNISTLINELFAKIQAAWKNVVRYFQDKRFQAAVKWVTDRKQELLKMRLNDITIQVINYKVDLKLPDGFDNLINNLGNIPDSALTNQDELNKWIKSLYPNDTVYGWWTGDDKNQEAIGALKYRNLFLFQDLNQVDDKHHEQPVKIGDSQIAKNFNGWIVTIEESQKVFNQMKQIEQRFEQSLNKLKAKAASATNQVNGNAGQQNNDGNGGNGGDQGGSNTDPNQTPAIIQQAITGATQASLRLLTPLFKMIMEYLNAEYSYIQQAYNEVNAKQNQNS